MERIEGPFEEVKQAACVMYADKFLVRL